ncbi:MAG TPA: TetR/AcrR family transcriptional regulator [Microbacteriaceae bacterium]|nr:TetR/AcrR family transcriptional regulator [Microbacteriaceae bacterium]
MTAPRRGPARSEAARVAILESTARLVAERGYEDLTIEGIAADAGVGKQTIYRWWGSKAALVANCLFEGRLLPAEFLPPDTGDLRADLADWLETVLEHVAAPETATLFRSLAAAAAVDESIGRGLGEVLAAGDTLTGRLARAIAAGDLPPDTSPKLVVDALVGVVVLRVITRGPVEPGLPGRLVAAVLPRS